MAATQMVGRCTRPEWTGQSMTAMCSASAVAPATVGSNLGRATASGSVWADSVRLRSLGQGSAHHESQKINLPTFARRDEVCLKHLRRHRRCSSRSRRGRQGWTEKRGSIIAHNTSPKSKYNRGSKCSAGSEIRERKRRSRVSRSRSSRARKRLGHRRGIDGQSLSIR